MIYETKPYIYKIMEIGQVIGSTTLRGFRFVIKNGMEKNVKRDEFVVVNESVTGNKILGIIKDIIISNELLPDEFGRDLRLGDILLNEGEYPVPTVKVLGYEGSNGLEMPRYGIKPGSSVYLADDDIVKRILRQEEKKAACVGTLSTRESVPVYISVNDLISRHCAILAMTGSGKSYTVGVVIEELLKKKGAVVVFDPHGEYKGISMGNAKTKVYGVKGDSKIKIETSSLRSIDFINLVPDLTEAQRDLIDAVITLARKFYDRYDLNIIKDVMGLIYDAKEGRDILAENISEGDIKELSKRVGLTTIGSTIRKIERLNRLAIFELKGTPIEDIVAGNQLTVIDLSDADERLSETIIAAITRRIFEARKAYVKDGEGRFDVPAFLIVEEAHNFAPRTSEDRKILSRSILKKIAREGRKFGVGLCIVSQRPSRLDADVLSQCNTQIILKIVNPADQEYIRQSVESVTEDIVRDLPSLSRGEAIIAGAATKLPVTVKIRERVTAVGGEDIDVVEQWSRKCPD
ncbi:MAG: ATP-binding protein [Candidatus Altiarchaeota archaeon]|nr:ATP-binding protein [Candidatus Altiarchaeota archaeon]